MTAEVLALREAVALARHDRRQALLAREKLALDNVLLAQRAANAERQLAAAQEPGRLSSLLGWGRSAPGGDPVADELAARADENVQLQHALFGQQRESEQALATQDREMRVASSLLRAELAAAEGAALQAAAEAERTGFERGRANQRAAIDELHAVCLELRLRCASMVDELEANAESLQRHREREAAHRRWRGPRRAAAPFCPPARPWTTSQLSVWTWRACPQACPQALCLTRMAAPTPGLAARRGGLSGSARWTLWLGECERPA